jgi:acrylyl-CoA reductase (NADPH)
MALEEHGLAAGEAGEILVTGATGGVGSVAISLLAHLGYRVTAVTGRMERAPFLKGLGASDVISRAELTSSNKPLQSERWAGAIDTAGGATLAAVLSGVAYGKSVAACGLAGGSDLPTTVFPFILRGVNLLGIDSCYASNEKRARAWQRLSLWADSKMAELQPQVIRLGEAPIKSAELLESKLQGRVVVDVNL